MTEDQKDKLFRRWAPLGFVLLIVGFFCLRYFSHEKEIVRPVIGWTVSTMTLEFTDSQGAVHRVEKSSRVGLGVYLDSGGRQWVVWIMPVQK